MMTEKQYLEKVKYLKSIAPEHNLLKLLEKGFNKINVLYLQNILKSLKDSQSELPKEVPKSEVIHDDIFKKMLREKYHCQSIVRAKSNKFHECVTDEQRADISKSILELHEQQRELQKKIDYYEKYQSLPPEETEANDIPSDGLALASAIASARSSISIIQKEIEKFDTKVMYDEKHPLRQRWFSLENRLKNWKSKLNRLENEKKNRKTIQ